MGDGAMKLEEEAAAVTRLLAGKVVRIIRRHRDAELLVEFTDGARLFIDGKLDGLELSVTGVQDPN
jgi:hypothetical protein